MSDLVGSKFLATGLTWVVLHPQWQALQTKLGNKTYFWMLNFSKDILAPKVRKIDTIVKILPMVSFFLTLVPLPLVQFGSYKWCKIVYFAFGAVADCPSL